MWQKFGTSQFQFIRCLWLCPICRFRYQNLLHSYDNPYLRGVGCHYDPSEFSPGRAKTATNDFTKRFYDIVPSSFAVILPKKTQTKNRGTTFNGVVVSSEKSKVGGGHCDSGQVFHVFVRKYLQCLYLILFIFL